ncbi:MAG: DHA2 family efflux MFS transporter permease subunit [Candidatus Omnitrophica bacterium]|nr:DHA2 family efflux MFS transporter permease subunit [Candidatus Omnitrophota bacterium]
MAQSSSPIQEETANGVSKWLVATAVMFGAFMAVMDISVVNVALPYMMGNFGQTLSAITWVATAYSIAAVIMLTMSGWWVTLVGRKNFYLASFAIFTFGSILAATAHNFTSMLIYRIIQGIGGGSLIPISQAILRESFPKKEQGMAMAIFSMGVVLAPAFGPVLGGWLTDNYGWPWIFYINIPVSLLGMFLVWLYVHDPAYLRRGIKKIDWGGIVLLTLGLTGLQTVLERGQQESWFDSPMIIIFSIVTVVSLVTLVVWELLQSEPVVNFRLLKNIQLRMGVIIVLVFGIALYGTTFILPQFTQQLLGYPAFQAGLILMPRAVTLFFVLPLVGRIFNFIDSRAMMVTGIVVVSLSYWQLAHLSLSASDMSIIPILILMGLGMPFMFVTLTTVAVSSISKEEMTSASGIYNLFQQVGGNVGYALIVTVIERQSQVHHACLVEHISLLNKNFTVFYHQAQALFVRQGVAGVDVKPKMLALVQHMVNRQADMMAYNDTSIVLMIMFIVLLPLVMLFPVIKSPKEAVVVTEV